MTDTNQTTPAEQWTSVQAYVLAVICLLVGIAAAGSSADPRVRRPPLKPPARRRLLQPWESGSATANSGSDAENGRLTGRSIDREAQGGPSQCRTSGQHRTSTTTLSSTRSHRLLSARAEGRASQCRRSYRHGHAYWYTGDADTAIAEFQKSLSYEPNKPNALFNLGIVEWQGKMDIGKATAAWQKLLDTNPNYEGKDKVLELMAQAKKHSGVKPGTPANPCNSFHQMEGPP